MRQVKKLFIFILLFCVYLFNAYCVKAVKYDLIAPGEMLNRGQEVQFIININTEGKTIKTAQIGMSYDTVYLQYLSTTAGNTFSTINTENLGQGKLVLTASNETGFSGSGTFARVNFKLIATAPGATEICVLFNPETTPSPTQSIITPTALPKTGTVEKMASATGIGLSLLLVSSVIIFLLNKKTIPYSSHLNKHSKKTGLKNKVIP